MHVAKHNILYFVDFRIFLEWQEGIAFSVSLDREVLVK